MLSHLHTLHGGHSSVWEKPQAALARSDRCTAGESSGQDQCSRLSVAARCSGLRVNTMGNAVHTTTILSCPEAGKWRARPTGFFRVLAVVLSPQRDSTPLRASRAPGLSSLTTACFADCARDCKDFTRPSPISQSQSPAAGLIDLR